MSGPRKAWHTEKKKIVIFGGTHGNETNGVFLINTLRQEVKDKKFNFDLHLEHSNSRAIELNRRYFETDLNRCFSEGDLANSELTLYEQLLAKSINQQFGPKGSDSENRADCIIDLHNTTANTGILLLGDADDVILFQIFAYLQKSFPDIRLMTWAKDPVFLPTVGHSGLTLEVGAVPQGCLDANLFMKTKAILYKILEFFTLHNDSIRNHPERTYDNVPTVTVDNLFTRLGAYNYPRDCNKQITAMAHPDIQYKDFTELKDGDNILLQFDGTSITWKGDTVYPFFINEAAYYEKDMVFQYGSRGTTTVPKCAFELD